jgi:hypothetical protein
MESRIKPSLIVIVAIYALILGGLIAVSSLLFLTEDIQAIGLAIELQIIGFAQFFLKENNRQHPVTYLRSKIFLSDS